jgi:hypothetical protein
MRNSIGQPVKSELYCLSDFGTKGYSELIVAGMRRASQSL